MEWYEKIKILRLSNGWSQQDLAEKCGYTHKSAIQKIEKGERKLSLSKMKQIADALGVDVWELTDIEMPNKETPAQPISQAKQEFIKVIIDADDETFNRLVQLYKLFAEQQNQGKQ